MNPESLKKVRALRDKYQDKADAYWHDYMVDGQASQLRTHERNQLLADALRECLDSQEIRDKYSRMKVEILYCTDVEATFKRLQAEIKEGLL